MAPASPRAACTIILVRPQPVGFSVFMVQRHRKSGFLPNAWVFPGGGVDAADGLVDHPGVTGGEATLRAMGLPRAEAVAYLVAGVRETFEEAGIWLGEGSLPADARARLNAREATLGELLDESGARVDLDRVGLWSWWTTPEAEPRRYDTRFLVALVEEEDGRHDERETVDSGWIDPREILQTATHETFPMAPPTWWTLRELAALDLARDVLRAANEREHGEILPIIEFDEGFHLYLPGHPRHARPAVPGLPVHIGFADGRWVADFAEDGAPDQ